MNNKRGLLPRLAVMGIRKNGSTYLPYIGVSIFAIFTFFVFDLILKNDIMTTIPRAEYALMLMYIGFFLLGLIMVPFLYYTNSFLIKRRKRELGLYSILGMEKKHIGVMMLLETIIIYIAVTAGAIALGLLFSKLLFLLLLNLAKLPVEAAFAIDGRAIGETLGFYAVISLINLSANLVQVGKANPAELMSESKKGEKEPKHIFIWTVAGLFTLGWGYYLAIASRLDVMIFLNFFLAVFLVVAGTHFLLTSGSIALLRGFKKNRRFYYKPQNFVTVSGMLYRMKKSAASLVNICIFGTMTIITVVCTVSLYLGMPSVKEFTYPFDLEARFLKEQMGSHEEWLEQMQQLARQEGVSISQRQEYSYVRGSLAVQNNRFLNDDGSFSYADVYGVYLMTLEEFNALEGTAKELGPQEVFIFSTGHDYGYPDIFLGEKQYTVREEPDHSKLSPKEKANQNTMRYFVILPDEHSLQQTAAAYGMDSDSDRIWITEMNLEGEEARLESFAAALDTVSQETPGYYYFHYYAEDVLAMASMYGGLLFIGIFFGTIFLMCLLIIMYYKQITEGFEDQASFEIMQKVGMSDQEVKKTIKKQILLVFFIPLAGACMHTAVGINMVIKLLGVLNLYQTWLIIGCAVAVCAVFAILYSLCYSGTARTYYRIVKKMA